MYYSIQGQVEHFEEDKLIVNCNGIGYEIIVSANTLSRFATIGETVKVFTFLSVSQDSVRLFGFYSKEEKSMFEKLISISGVGPKMAIQILSGVDCATLALAIVNVDVSSLSNIKGIGKKTASRIILELKEKIEKEDIAGLTVNDTAGIFNAKDQVSEDAILALISLGLSKNDAAKKVAAVRNQANSVEEIIKLVLRGIGN